MLSSNSAYVLLKTGYLPQADGNQDQIKSEVRNMYALYFIGMIFASWSLDSWRWGCCCGHPLPTAKARNSGWKSRIQNNLEYMMLHGWLDDLALEEHWSWGEFLVSGLHALSHASNNKGLQVWYGSI